MAKDEVELSGRWVQVFLTEEEIARLLTLLTYRTDTNDLRKVLQSALIERKLYGTQ